MQLLRNSHGPPFKPGADLAGHLSTLNTGPRVVTPAKTGVQVFGAKSLPRGRSGGKPGMTLWGRRTSYFHGNDATS